jgi:3-hydroxyisobutyrate dehydrogenase-like beta-hydroxyacid dehydrogenase
MSRRLTTTKPPKNLGFLGLGAMGGPMARNLIGAGYDLIVYDPAPERLALCVEHGATAGCCVKGVVEAAEVVLTSLRTSAMWVEVAGTELVPNAHEGQVFIDLGTVAPPETRRVAELFAARGATLLDVPVSGGPGGSASGTLRMFAGGDRAAFERCLGLLEVLGDAEHIVYCGPSGAGQVVKGVNQLAMGLGAAAWLESLAFGVRCGVDPAAMKQAVGGHGGWRGEFAAVCDKVIAGEGHGIWVKFPELRYFLAEAAEQGFELPLTAALQAFLEVFAPDRRDNMGRPTVSFWEQLTGRDGEATP